MNEPFLIIGAAASLIGLILHLQFRFRYPVPNLNDQEKRAIDQRRFLVNMSIVLLGLFLLSAAFVSSKLWQVTTISAALILAVAVVVLSMRDVVAIYHLRRKYCQNHRLDELKEEIDTIVAINRAAKEAKKQESH